MILLRNRVILNKTQVLESKRSRKIRLIVLSQVLRLERCNCSHKKSTTLLLESRSVSFNRSYFLEFPKSQSNILSNVKHDVDDDRGQIRAGIFLSAESAKLIKMGNIQNKDLAIEVCA